MKDLGCGKTIGNGNICSSAGERPILCSSCQKILIKKHSIFYSFEEYACSLTRAIEYHCRGLVVPSDIADICPHHAKMLNDHLMNKQG